MSRKITTAECRQRVNAVGRVSAKAIAGPGNGHTKPSVLDELYQQGSARIRFPRTEPGPLQAVLLNTAGGLTGGDQIHWKACAAEHSHLSISTAACEKIYRTHGPAAIQKTILHVAGKARLEWLPQESILFNGSHLERTLDVHLEEQAQALIVESLVLGRQAMKEDINRLCIRDRWRIYLKERLLHAEDFYLDTNSNNDARTQCMLHHHSAISTVVMIADHPDGWYESLATRISSLNPAGNGAIRIGVSALPGRLVVRVLARNSFLLRKFLIPCIKLLNDERPIPTVWNV